MITTITLGALTLTCRMANKPQLVKLARINIPGRDGDILQSMGKSSKEFFLIGKLDGATMDADKVTLEGYLNTTQTYNDGIDNLTVFVESVNIPTVGGQPNHYEFTLRLIKYDQT